MSKIRWVGLKELRALSAPDGDMYSPRASGWFVVSWGVNDGWCVSVPGGSRWAFDGRTWIVGPSNAPPRGRPGAVTLEQARLFAESLIHKSEGTERPSGGTKIPTLQKS